MARTTIFSMDTNSNWQNNAATSGDQNGTNTDTSIKVQGTGSVGFIIDVSKTVFDRAYFDNSTDSKNLSSLISSGYIYFWVYIPNATYLSGINFRMGSDSSNYYNWSGAYRRNTDAFGNKFINGWNLVKCPLSGVNVQGSPNASALDFWLIAFDYTSSFGDQTIRIDYIFHDTEDVAVKSVLGVAKAGDFEDQQYLGGNTDEYYGYTSPDKIGLGQGFIPSVSGKLRQISLELKKTGSPTNISTVYLYSDDGSGKPNASLGTIDTLDESTLTTSYVWYDFDVSLSSAPNVVKGTQYHIVILTTSQSSANYIRVNANANGNYPDGHATQRTAAGVWSNVGGVETYDLNFKTSIQAVNAIEKIAGVVNTAINKILGVRY